MNHLPGPRAGSCAYKLQGVRLQKLGLQLGAPKTAAGTMTAKVERQV